VSRGSFPARIVFAGTRRRQRSGSDGRRRERPGEGAGFAGVRSLVAGPGSDFSEAPALECKPAALEPVAAPGCPPGPVTRVRALVIIW
jgi:hypothetical protein